MSLPGSCKGRCELTIDEVGHIDQSDERKAGVTIRAGENVVSAHGSISHFIAAIVGTFGSAAGAAVPRSDAWPNAIRAVKSGDDPVGNSAITVGTFVVRSNTTTEELPLPTNNVFPSGVTRSPLGAESGFTPFARDAQHCAPGNPPKEPFGPNPGNALPKFAQNGSFGGLPGAQCCASRANGVTPLSAPNGLLVTPDGNTLFVGSGSSSVVVFDLTTQVPTVIADFPTGSSPDFDGPNGVGPCIASWNGGAGSAPECADDRGDEMAYGTVGGHDILTIAHGDPGLPFVTLIDVTDLVNRKFTPPFTTPGQGHCLPVNYPAYPNQWGCS